MKFAAIFLALLAAPLFAQTTVPITLDHNRIIIDVRLPLPDGTTTRVRAWVDNGNPDMWITERLARKLGLQLSGDVKEAKEARVQSSQVPTEIRIGDLAIHPTYLKESKALLDRNAIAPGLSAEINIPSTVLRNYDVSVDYLNREFTVGLPGTIHFAGTRIPAKLNGENGLVQISSDLAGTKNNLALDFGAAYSFLSADALSQLMKAHPQWPHMIGAIGAANMWGREEEVGAQLVRAPELKYGTVTLTQVGMESFPKEFIDWFQQRAGIATVGLLGANAFLAYRVGIDYAHSAVYFDRTSKTIAPEMDVVGIILRPEPNEKYTIAGIPDFEGKPAVPDMKPGDILVKIDGIDTAGGTMGQAWSLLGGSPGDTRELTLERDGKQFIVKATVHRFLDVAKR